MPTTKPTPADVAAAMKRFADATSVYMLSMQAARDAARELLAAQAVLQQLGITIAMPGAPAAPTSTPSSGVDPDAEIRDAIAKAEEYKPKPPKTDAT